MSKRLSALISMTDGLMLLYWTATALAQLGLIHLPRDWMYANYDLPGMVAWNWSFFPLDVAFSAFGFAAVAAARRGDLAWRPLALVSLTLTSVAGLMAVSYWSFTGQFDASWFAANLALLVWPLFFLPPLMKRLGRRAAD